KYKVILDSKNFDSFYENILNTYEIPITFKNIINSIKAKVYNPNGVTYSSLEATRKSLNKLYSGDNQLDDFLQNFINSHLREEIDKGIQSIFSQNKTAFEEAKRLYETNLRDYAQLKEIQNLPIYKKITKRKKSLKNIAKSILKNAEDVGRIENVSIKGVETSKELINNFEDLTKGLTPQNRQSLELNLLSYIFDKSLEKESKESKDAVFNSREFLSSIKEVKEIFQSKGAKEYIQIIEDFHTLFKKDADILNALPNPSAKEKSSSIATTIERAYKHTLIKGIFDFAYRNLPHDNAIIKFINLSEGVQKAALKYHLKKALKESDSLDSFNFNITQRATRGRFNSPTKELIEKLVDDISNAKNEVIREAGEETLKQIKAKTIQAVDNFANSPKFQALSKDKQEAILSLKSIEPSPMPEGIN
ncbi:MAG: hypothetical protein K2I63_04815, partial [Helicobacter sp.]|nr:hypothetical protein [Helicobacter sp.]